MIKNIEILNNSVKESLDLLANKSRASVFGDELKSVDKSIKQIAWKAKKLTLSKKRNAAISVYGPSQVGKSFLASVLVRPNEGYLEIEFPGDAGKRTYIDEINPGGDQECTGIVTRFTLNSEKIDNDFPVYIRLLSEIDLICIIVNSYFSEGDQKLEEHQPTQYISEFIGKISPSGNPTHLSEEDFWELDEYIREHFSSFEYANTISPFVEVIGQKALNSDVGQRAKLYSALWGFHEEFTELFIKVASALEDLKYSEDAHTKLGSLIPKARSIIDVSLLSEINNPESDKIEVKGHDGEVVTIGRGILSAITSELILKMSGVPHDFFKHTDVLDFPGTRNRKPDDLKKVFADFTPGKSNIHEFYLRGKVAYLFDKYVNSQDINSMLLCIKDSAMEAVGLPNMIEKWVANSIGAKSLDRDKKENNLFFVMTYFDKHLSDTASNRHETDRFKRRIFSSLIERFGNHKTSWPQNWNGTDDAPKPFTNCFWLRNPGVDQNFFKIDPNTGVETFIAVEEEQNRLNEIKAMFLATEEVKKHFNNPEKAWDAVLKENDGGSKYILENLSIVCKSDTKINQLDGLAQNLAKDLHSTLYDFFIPTDTAEKKRVSEEKLAWLRDQILTKSQIIKEGKFSSFLQALSLDDNFLQARLADVNAHNLQEYIKDIFEIWADHLKSMSGQISKDFGIDKSSIEFLVHELSISLSINKFADTVNQKISFLGFQGVTERSKRHAIEISTFMINDFISDQFFEKNNDNALKFDKERPNLQKQFASRWISRLEDKVAKNVISEDGTEINQDANQALEKIISDLGSING